MPDSDNNGHGQQQTARLMHVKELGSKSNRLGLFAHCDGLVFAPTEKELYLLDPGHRGRNHAAEKPPQQPAARPKNLPLCWSWLGSTHWQVLLTPIQGSITIRKFQWGWNCSLWTVATTRPGPGRRRWKIRCSLWAVATTTRPAGQRRGKIPLLRWQTGVTLKGFIFWRVDTAQYCQSCAGGLVRLTLEFEGFSIIPLPGSMRICDDFMLDALHGQGELCLTTRTGDDVSSVTIWMMPVHKDDDDLAMGHAQWELRYSIPLGLPPHRRLCRLMALVAGGTRILLWSDRFHSLRI